MTRAWLLGLVAFLLGVGATGLTLLARDHSELDMNSRREARVPCRLDDVKRLSIVRGRFGEIASRERGHTQEE